MKTFQKNMFSEFSIVEDSLFFQCKSFDPENKRMSYERKATGMSTELSNDR